MHHNCLVCSTVFRSYSEYQEHMKSHKGPLKCPQCVKTFAYRATLKKHLLIHTNEKNYVCKICNKAMNRKENMKRHYEMVHKVKGGSVMESTSEYHKVLREMAEQFSQAFRHQAKIAVQNHSKFDFRRLGETHGLPSTSSSSFSPVIIQRFLTNPQYSIPA